MKRQPNSPFIMVSTFLFAGALTACTQERVEIHVELDPLTQMVKDCEGGSGPACFELGQAYQNEQPPSLQQDQAANAFKRGCKLGSGPSCTNAGFVQRENLGHEELISFYRQGCELNDSQGCANLGSALMRIGDATRVPDALLAYERGCKGGIALACHNAGKLLTKGTDIERDLVRARPFIQRSCELDPVFCAEEGVGFAQGWYGPPDFDKAASLFQRACEAGGSEGCVSLSALMIQGKATSSGSPGIADLSKKACDLGHAQGCANYAILLRDGEHGVDKDPEASSKYFDKACALGKEDVCE